MYRLGPPLLPIVPVTFLITGVLVYGTHPGIIPGTWTPENQVIFSHYDKAKMVIIRYYYVVIITRYGNSNHTNTNANIRPVTPCGA